MKVFAVVEVSGGMNSGDRMMVEITDAVVLAEYRKLHGSKEPFNVKLEIAEWVIEK